MAMADLLTGLAAVQPDKTAVIDDRGSDDVRILSYAELEDGAKGLKKELSLVEGVARVKLWGVQPKVIYLEASETQLSQLGISDKSIVATMQQQNVVVRPPVHDLLREIPRPTRRLQLFPSPARPGS